MESWKARVGTHKVLECPLTERILIVFGSPVRSGFLSIKGLELGPGLVFLYPNSEETRPNCNEPVYIGFLRFFPVARPVLTSFITLFTLLYIYTYYECK